MAPLCRAEVGEADSKGQRIEKFGVSELPKSPEMNWTT